MSIALTATASPVVIDLTIEPPTASPYIHVGASQSFQLSIQEPHPKKRRVDLGRPPTWDLKARMQEHLVPYVESAVVKLAADKYLVDKIAIQAVTTLIKSTGIREKLELTDGSLSVQDLADLEKRATQVIQHLIRLPKTPKLRKEEATPSAPRQLTLRPPVPPKTAPEAGQRAIQPVASSQVLLKPDTRPTRVPRQRVCRHLVVRKPKTSPPAASPWSQLQQRPYLRHAARQDITRKVKYPVPVPRDSIQLPVVYHADFSSVEIAEMVQILEQCLAQSIPRTRDGLLQMIQQLDVPLIVGDAIHGRTKEDICNFISDLHAGKAGRPNDARVLSLHTSSPEKKARNRSANRLPALLLAREMEGNVGFGRMRRLVNFQNEFQTCREDGLALVAEFTNCAGDISAISWVPDENVLCGTTAHSDAHNQQYNKPGNLLLCSTNKATLRAFPDHRIPRPVIEKGENSTEAMRQSQDPWLYSSVVSTDYDERNGWAFTSSFDKTVKAWDVAKEGTGMTAIATWHHSGNVNFVAAAKDGSGRVATAADVPTQAIRIYTVDPNNVQGSAYYTISCTRNDADGCDKWAYFPATMHWGRAPGTQHLLAIGYSPRSFTGDDNDIPEDKLHSGEIVLWDARQRCQTPVLTATTANVFEIMWHPDVPSFIVATSPSGLFVEHGVRTQIHLFRPDREREDGAYSEFQKLDCPALDINELTIMPNSPRHSYITAGCTDGRVYVWDTAQGDHPIHTLEHGNPLDACLADREKEDTGIKFTAWGATPDRFYTGSSDGVVKVWNVRRRRRPFVRKLLEAPGPISCGIFSPNHSKLVVGDATGRVFLFSVDDRDAAESHMTTIPGTNRRVRRPTPFIPHPEPEPPTDTGAVQPSSASSIAQYSREQYLDSGQLILHPNRVIGTVQGPMYPFTGLFRAEAHVYSDVQGPLIPEFERNQRETVHASLGRRARSCRRLREAPQREELDKTRHDENTAKDLNPLALEASLYAELASLGAQLDLDGEEGWDFAYEDMPVDEED